MFLRITPVDEKVSDGEALRGFVKRRLVRMVARVGDVLCLGCPVGFRVLEVRPEEGRIGEGTEFLFEGLEPAREMAPHLRARAAVKVIVHCARASHPHTLYFT